MINEIANFILVITLIIIIYKFYETQTHEVVYIKSKLNGVEYMVRKLPDAQEAADLLGYLSITLTKFVDYLRTNDITELYEKHIDGKEFRTTAEKFATDVKRLIRNFNPNVFSESSPNAKYTSYSVNKGQKIVFCLRSKTTNELVDKRTMLFVALHELGHLMTKSIGHTQEFWDNFKIILAISIDEGIYSYVNFYDNPQEYCGTNITDTPYNPHGKNKTK